MPDGRNSSRGSSKNSSPVKNTPAETPVKGDAKRKKKTAKSAATSLESNSSLSIDPTPQNNGTEDAAITPSSLSLAAALPMCKHIPSMGEFLKMYLNRARTICTASAPLSCATCDAAGSPMLLVCIVCGRIGCWRLIPSDASYVTGESHLLHQHTESAGHALWLEVGNGAVFCTVCKAWIWTDAMDSIWNFVRTHPSNSECLLIRTIEFLRPNLSLDTPIIRTCPVVRGLYNLGNTCFMNSVLQILLHTRPLRAHFLSPVHPAHSPPCPAAGVLQSSLREHSSHSAGRDTSCIACELDSLYCRLFDGKTTPLAPHQMLAALWRSAKDLAGYDQQDAHELLIALRNALHQKLGGNHYNCQCIIHHLFAGVLQSDLTCGSCGHVAETFDPCLDISLDLPPSTHVGAGEVLRLEDCLVQFTRPESLHPGGITCGGCHREEVEMEKRMRIRQVPLILTIHLKRFDGLATKVDTPLRYPLHLDLNPFMANSTGLPIYDLYAVINHVGSIDSGHYTSYVRNRGEWFLADDACVTACSEEEACNANAYMVFYQQQQQQQQQQSRQFQTNKS